MQERNIDIAILGGGLAGGLIALSLAKQRPDLTLALVEAGATFGGNHVWSFFASDVAPEDKWLVEPLISATWDGYSVHFPGHSRNLGTPYHSITSERLDQELRHVLPPQAMLTGVQAVSTGPTAITLSDGRNIVAGGVIDARGATSLPHMKGGWQKFVGQMLRTEEPHGLTRPIVMDARVEQRDGFRFVYCLPFSETEIFVEDTYYSNGPELDLAVLRSRLARYAQVCGWRIAEVSREETGVLPVIADGDFETFWNFGDKAAKAGSRAALIHPLTSYSLPDAVRFAQHIAHLDDLSGAALPHASYAWAKAHWRKGGFYRLLARMLFGAAQPLERYRILERFYTLPKGLIERFYAGRSSLADKARILAGRPPVPVSAAIAALTRPVPPLTAEETGA